jgi:hypothetical protein
MRPMLTPDRLRHGLAREAIILLGFLLLAAALWGGATLWNWATLTAVQVPPFQVMMLNPSSNGVLLYLGFAPIRLLVWTSVRLWRQAARPW